MSKFVIGQPLVTKVPAVTVDAGLAIGAHRFQLVVINAAGVKSAAVEATIQVQAVKAAAGTSSTVFTTTPAVAPVTSTRTLNPGKAISPAAVASPKSRTSRKKRSHS